MRLLFLFISTSFMLLSLTSQANNFAPVAQNVCSRYSYLEDTQSCLKDLSNLTFDETAVNLCSKYNYIEDTQSCLKDLSNLTFSEVAANTCLRYSYISESQNCLKSMGQELLVAITFEVKNCHDYEFALQQLREKFESTDNDAFRTEIRETLRNLNNDFDICID